MDESYRAILNRAINGCERGPHRGPEGPNEDLAGCPLCWGFSWELRPEGETYGEHLPDCSLPIRHESYCEPGGSGHPSARVIRGYWPVQCACGHIDFPHADRIGACSVPGCECSRYAPQKEQVRSDHVERESEDHPA